jgi:hypothetical protein
MRRSKSHRAGLHQTQDDSVPDSFSDW